MILRTLSRVHESQLISFFWHSGYDREESRYDKVPSIPGITISPRLGDTVPTSTAPFGDQIVMSKRRPASLARHNRRRGVVSIDDMKRNTVTVGTNSNHGLVASPTQHKL